MRLPERRGAYPRATARAPACVDPDNRPRPALAAMRQNHPKEQPTSRTSLPRTSTRSAHARVRARNSKLAAACSAPPTRFRIATATQSTPHDLDCKLAGRCGSCFDLTDLAHPAAGGAEVFAEQVSGELVSRGHSVTVFASAASAGPPASGETAWKSCAQGKADRVSRSPVLVEAKGRLRHRRGRDQHETFMSPRWIRDAPIVALIFHCTEVWFTETPLPVAALGRYVLEPVAAVSSRPRPHHLGEQRGLASHAPWVDG